MESFFTERRVLSLSHARHARVLLSTMSTPTGAPVSNVSSSKTPAIAEGIEVPAFTDNESEGEDCEVARHLPADLILIDYFVGAPRFPRKLARGPSAQKLCRIHVTFGSDIVREISRLDNKGTRLPSGTPRRSSK